MITDKAMQWLETHLPDMRRDLIELANHNSGSDNLEGLRSVARWLEDAMRFEHTLFRSIELPTRSVVRGDGQVVQQATGPLLRWDFRADAPHRVMLAIHYDTVFGKEHPFQSCVDLAEDRINGPGVADAKGGILVIRNALQALQEAGWMPEMGWTVVLNPDEEVGSPSSTAYFHEIAEDFDFGLLFEPSLPSGELVAARKGSGNFDLVVKGKAAHAGRHFDEGRNAVALLSRILVQLDALNGEREGATINVGAVQGGGPVNIVPDLAVGRFNARLPDQASMDWFHQRLREIVDRADAEEGLSVELYGGIASPPKEVGSRMANLMGALESVQQDLFGETLRWTATGGVCDGNKFAAAGLPNIDTLGPVGGELHSAQEWVQVSSLVDKAKTIVSLLARFDAGDFPALRRTA